MPKQAKEEPVASNEEAVEIDADQVETDSSAEIAVIDEESTHDDEQSPIEDDMQGSLSFAEASEVRRLLRQVYARLMETDGLHFSSLVIRRLDDGVICLKGSVRIDFDGPDIENVASEIPGIDSVVNHLVVQTQLPATG
ncbi:MAG: hypothetical protein CMJ78_03130 [Planctomycetaceae bacterium]|nr:hypothetical protein [Planctomycetaceae bacterium]